MAHYDDEKLVVLDVDGLMPSALQAAFAEASLPNLTRILGNNGKSSLTLEGGLVSSAPSITMAAQASLVTGEPLSQHCIAGNSFLSRRFDYRAEHFDLDGGDTFAIGDATGQACRNLGNRLIPRNIKTLFEVSDQASFSANFMYARGATTSIKPSFQSLVRLFKTSGSKRCEEFDDSMLDASTKALHNKVDRYGLYYFYFLGLDVETHSKGPSTQSKYIAEVLDRQIGRVLDLINWDQSNPITFALISDHGQRSIDPDSFYMLRAGNGQGRGLRRFFNRHGRKLYNPLFSEARCNAAIGLNSGLIHVYLRPIDSDWYTQPTTDKDLMPIAQALQRESLTGSFDIPKNAFTMILVRNNQAYFEGWQSKYDILDGDSLVTIENWLQRDHYPAASLVAFRQRINELSSSSSGDIVLILNNDNGVYAKTAYQSGTHGGFTADESNATCAISAPYLDSDSFSRKIAPTMDAVRSRKNVQNRSRHNLSDVGQILKSLAQ